MMSPKKPKKTKDLTYGQYFKEELPKVLGKNNPDVEKIQYKRLNVPVLKTKSIKSPADEIPRELAKRSPEPKKKGIKGLIQRAMTKGQLATRDVDGKPQMVREKSKTVKRGDGTVKKTVTKGKGVMGSNIGRYKDVKRYK